MQLRLNLDNAIFHPETAPTTRAGRLAELVEVYPSDGDGSEHEGGERFALIEQSTRESGRHWITTHDTASEASDYWGSQEYPGDWHPLLLVDLDTGAEYEPVPSLQWRGADPIPADLSVGVPFTEEDD